MPQPMHTVGRRHLTNTDGALLNKSFHKGVESVFSSLSESRVQMARGREMRRGLILVYKKNFWASLK